MNHKKNLYRNKKFDKIVEFIKDQFSFNDFIPLHEPKFSGNEKKYLKECIDSTYVSSVGKFVDTFEKKIASFTGTKRAIATVNGTAALHVSLILSGVKQNDEVITQPLTFVATCNAIKYCNANPVFIDVDRDTMGLSACALEQFLEKNVIFRDNKSFNKVTGNIIKACIPMHTFGFPCKIDLIKKICNKYNIALIEDCAESLGSYYKKKHTGKFGHLSAISFNGNKIITSGGGGCILTDNIDLANRAKHLTTTAKISHKWSYIHNEIGYNYRLPNLNAALLCAQIEQLPNFLNQKRELSNLYKDFFNDFDDVFFFCEPEKTKSNYWLNVIILKDRNERDIFLKFSNDKGVMTRPIWELMINLSMFKNCFSGDLSNSRWLADRVVNIPSSVRF